MNSLGETIKIINIQFGKELLRFKLIEGLRLGVRGL